MIQRTEPDERQLASPLGRLSPLTKLTIAIAWLILSAFFIADGLRDALDPRTQEAA